MKNPEFHVGGWRVQPSLCRLSRDGQSVRVRAKVMDLLVYLAHHADEVVSKDDLLANVWHCEVVAEAALTRTVTELRRALGDSPSDSTFIETVPKRGYRLVAAVSGRIDAKDVVPAASETGTSVPQQPAEPIGDTGSNRIRTWIGDNRSRRRITSAVAGVLMALLLGAVAFEVLRPAVRASMSRDHVVIAVDNETGESLFDTTLATAIERELTTSSTVQVIPRVRVEETLRLMRRPAGAAFDPPTALEAAVRTGDVRAVISVHLTRSGTEYALLIQAIAPSTGAVLDSTSEHAAGRSGVWNAVHQAVTPTLRAVALAPPAPPQRLARVTTSSLRALELYSQAEELLDRDPTAAERLLRDALHEDAAFASAEILLAWALHASGGANADFLRIANTADEHAERVSAPERHFVRGSVHHLRAFANLADGRELEDAAAEYEATLDLEPDHPLAAFNATQVYASLARPVDAATMAARVADECPDSVPANVVAAQRFLEAYGVDAARPYIARARAALDRTSPRTVFHPAQRAYVLLFPAHALWVARRPRDAAALLDHALEWPELAGDGDHAFAMMGGLELALGRVKRAENAFARMHDGDLRSTYLAVAALARDDNAGIVAELRQFHGSDLSPVSLLVRAGDLAQADHVLHAVLASHGVPAQHVRWATGEIEQARGDADRIHDAVRDGVPWTHVMTGVRAFLYSETLARTAAAAGDRAGAIRVLEETSRLGDRTYPVVNHTGYLWMRVRLLLADQYRAVGRLDDARVIERDLMTRLATADADHPMVADLRRRSAQDHRGHDGT